ncbi:MAG: hypothetical protein KME18_18125 [Phormidium tanganyikae FI6-MK23]|jgi:hypothetical protein|nr:hypothetical protein [Phormidium tanganyikae FI6-MK23]
MATRWRNNRITSVARVKTIKKGEKMVQTKERKTKASKVTTSQTFLASIDPGNQNIDVVYAKMSVTGSIVSYDDQVHKTVKSLVSEDVEQYTFTQAGLIDGSGEVTTRQFGIGEYPGAQWIKDSPDGKAQWVLPALIHCMWDDLADVDSITVYTSVHNPEAYRAEMKAALNGRFTFVKDDEQKNITVKCDRVLVEGVGAIKAQNPPTAANLLLDLGGQTVMIAPYSGLKLMSGCDQPYQLLDQGTARLIAEFAKCRAVNEALKRVMTYREARSVIDNPAHTFQGHDFSGAVGKEVHKWLEKVVGSIEGLAKHHLAECPNRYATGGAVLIPSVRQWLLDRGYTPVTEPLSANVQGVFTLAQALEQKDAAK